MSAPELTTVHLAAGADRTELDLRWGGRLRSLVAGGAERLLTGPPTGQEPRDLLWGTYVMAPWAGRIRDAVLEWRGRRIELRRNYGAHSIHGLVFDREVEVVEQTSTALTTRCPLDWELGGDVVQHAVLQPGALELGVEIRAGHAAMPAWAGWHPLFRRPQRGDVRVRVRAGGRLEATPDLIPTGKVLPADGDFDLADGPALGDRRLDVVYTDADRPAEIDWPDLRLEIDWEPPIETVVVYTPAFSFCVEPQNGWPDAVRLAGAGSPTGLVELEPGQALSLRSRWTWQAA